MHVTTTSETQGLTGQFDPAALARAVAAPEAPVLIKRSSRKSVLALSVCALAINGSAAIYTLPFDLPSPHVSSLAELLPRWEASAPKPDPVVAALKDIQSAQQQHAASLQENNHSLQQNAALQQQDSAILGSLRQSITDERVDVKKMSAQLSTLIAKVDSLQSAMMSEITSSIPRGRARDRLAMRKRLARQSKSLGPVSVGGAPLSTPATVSAPES
ncbi:hypothetical protein NLM33_08570 [Bradyrhizobium sp. CCGUVB1N3]|uniref:hypothetical protein n=1 Tax=Bradyrhizobium sp. CCGUVB1N3 TaxID=2949629 RepID=UPI0020B1AE3E|nr:hypothetical protein [Bradyrhizobium sp. CCGUVB1N3]MCP3470373.1 hypothetical protein [Bradyrhizobium sp. CCGUVB1N3]